MGYSLLRRFDLDTPQKLAYSFHWLGPTKIDKLLDMVHLSKVGYELSPNWRGNGAEQHRVLCLRCGYALSYHKEQHRVLCLLFSSEQHRVLCLRLWRICAFISPGTAPCACLLFEDVLSHIIGALSALEALATSSFSDGTCTKCLSPCRHSTVC